MATRSRTTMKSPTSKNFVATINTLSRLVLMVAAVLLFAGAAHAQSGPCPAGQSPCLLVSDSGGVRVWSDDGAHEINTSLLEGSAGGGEGIACVSGSTNVLYVTTGGVDIGVYNMTLDTNGKAPLLKDFILTDNNNNSYAATGLAVDGTGTLLYVGSPSGYILSLTPIHSYPYLDWNTGQNTGNGSANAHDIAVGPGACPPNTPCPYAGNVFTDHFENISTGVEQYAPNLDLTHPLPDLGQFLPDIPPVGGNNCANFAGVGTRCWKQLSGMAFDSAGNLWASSDDPYQNGTFEFAPGGTCGAAVCPLNFVPDASGINALPIGLTVAPANDPHNAGKILMANFETSTVTIIDPTTCTGLHPTGNPWTPGTCNSSVFFSDPNPHAKYVIYSQGCPNPDNDGYLEICKQGNTQYPPPNQVYDFTATATMFSTGTVQVPLGSCSGPLQVPSGDLTVSETPVTGVLVSDVEAYSYNQLGQYVNQLMTWTEPELSAVVGVDKGDVSLETLATFTNYAASPGQLKICKVAGQNVAVGTPFNFTVTGPQGYRQTYTIDAGPEDQGGYCQLTGTFAANTPVTVTENLAQGSPYQVSNMTVDCNACTYSFPTSSSVDTTIGAGITEVSFTNVEQMMAQCSATGAVYSDGSVNAGLGAWPINFGYVTSDSFTVNRSGNPITGFCFYAWVYPGDVPTAVEASITSRENGGTSFFDANVNLSCQVYCTEGSRLGPPPRLCGESPKNNPSGEFNVYACTATINGPALSSGSYWLNLQNASVPSGNPVYWDQNNGVKCSGLLCPSAASEDAVGTILPEAFVIY